MIYVGRIDESDTHGKEPDMTMSAMLGSAEEWELLRRRLNSIRREYGFKVFHGTEFRSLTGEFANWPEEKCRKLVHDLGKAVAGTLRECVSVSCDYATYRDHFLAKRPNKRCTRRANMVFASQSSSMPSRFASLDSEGAIGCQLSWKTVIRTRPIPREFSKNGRMPISYPSGVDRSGAISLCG